MPTAFCAYHTDLAAVARCKGCRKLLCAKCRTRGHDGWYCGEQCMKGQAAQQQQVDTADRATKRGGVAGWVVRLVILGVVVGGLYWVFGVQGVRSVSDLQNLLP